MNFEAIIAKEHTMNKNLHTFMHVTIELGYGNWNTRSDN